MTWAFEGAAGLPATQSSGGNAIVTDAISVNAGELLVAIFRWEGADSDTVTGTISDGGAGLAWVPEPRYSGTGGTAEDQRLAVTWAVADATGNITLTWNFDGGQTRGYRTWHVLRYSFSNGFTLADESAAADANNVSSWLVSEFSVSAGDLVVLALAHYNVSPQPVTPSDFGVGFDGGLLDTYWRVYSEAGTHSLSTIWAGGNTESYATLALVFHEISGGAVYEVAISESISATDGAVDLLTSFAVASEGINASEILTGSAAHVMIALEACSAAESVAAQSIILSAIAELVALTDASVLLLSGGAEVVEQLILVDGNQAESVNVATLQESALASDQPSADATLLVGRVEAVLPVDSWSGTPDGSANVVESTTTQDVFAGAPTNVRVSSESVDASDDGLAAAILRVARSEQVELSDLALARSDGTVTVSEVLAAGDASVNVYSALTVVVESLSVGDLSQLIEDIDAAVIEAIASADLSVTTKTLIWGVPSSDRIARVKPITTIANVVKQRWM